MYGRSTAAPQLATMSNVDFNLFFFSSCLPEANSSVNSSSVEQFPSILHRMG
jgi:hypothetical protein